MSFGSPWLLLSLLALPVAVIAYRGLERRREQRSAAWATRAMLPNLIARRSRRMRHVPVVLILLGLTFLLVGFARPEQDLGTAHGGAATVALVFDVSGSMASTDVSPTRIRAARAVAVRFADGVPSQDRIAVLTFADNARLVVDPTFDRAAVLAGLPEAVTPRAGTRIGDGIDEALSAVIDAVGKGYPGDPQQPGAVVVLSDGSQTAGGVTPEEAANTAYLDGIPIDAVAVGTAGGTVTQPVTAAGQTVSTVIRVPVFPESLRAAAQESDGHFFTLDSASQVTSVAASLGAVDKTLASTTLPGERERELSTDTAAIALVLVAVGVLLSAFWFGRVA